MIAFLRSEAFSLYIANFPSALALTIGMTAAGMLLATIIGVLLAFGGRSRFLPVAHVSKGFTYIVRTIPQPPALLLVYFTIEATIGAPAPENATVLTLGLLYAPWVAELLRSGIQGVPIGLSEAGRALGMAESTIQRRVVIPMAIRIMFPTYGQLVMSFMLSTAIASQIGAKDVTGLARPIINSFFASELWIVVAGVYFLIAFPVSRFLNWAERKHLFVP